MSSAFAAQTVISDVEMDICSKELEAARDAISKESSITIGDTLRLVHAEKALLKCKNDKLQDELAAAREEISKQQAMLDTRTGELEWMKKACEKTTMERMFFFRRTQLREEQRDEVMQQVRHLQSELQLVTERNELDKRLQSLKAAASAPEQLPPPRRAGKRYYGPKRFFPKLEYCHMASAAGAIATADDTSRATLWTDEKW